jgi:Na+/H+ antiporter NhaC
MAPGGGGGHSLLPALLLPSNRAVGVVFWVGLLVVAVAVDLIARRSAGRVATAEEFARFISTSAVANVALIAAWAFAGYHLFAR